MTEFGANRKRDDGTVAEMLEKGFVRYEIGSFEVRCKAYALALQHGFLTVNEVRKLEGLPELEKVETV